MDQARFRNIALGAGLVGAAVAIATGRWPRRVRIALVAGVIAFACGVGAFAYDYFTRPETLTVAAGSVDGNAFRLMSAIAARLASTSSSVRLKVLDKGTALDAVKAFADGEADLATARADIGDLSAARTVVIVANAVVLIVVPPGSPIAKIDDLKGKTVGVLGMDLNRRVVDAITKEYDLNSAKTNFRDLALKDVAQAAKSKQVSAVLMVRPITERYLTIVRDLFPHQGKYGAGLIPIESAGAIAAVDRAYESYDLPKGTIRGSPPVPDDDLTTLRVPFYLIANKNLSDDVVATLSKEVMESRRDLVSEYPLLEQVSAPNTDKDAYIPIHPGAAAYFNGEQRTFFDKYGDLIFYGSILLGSLASILAGTWKFIARDPPGADRRALVRLYALAAPIGHATSEKELVDAEQAIDDILKAELERHIDGHNNAAEIAVLGLATHRLEHLIGQRRAAMRSNTDGKRPG
jgi:TRAP transporter TAXI family solute receptor